MEKRGIYLSGGGGLHLIHRVLTVGESLRGGSKQIVSRKKKKHISGLKKKSYRVSREERAWGTFEGGWKGAAYRGLLFAKSDSSDRTAKKINVLSVDPEGEGPISDAWRRPWRDVRVEKSTQGSFFTCRGIDCGATSTR